MLVENDFSRINIAGWNFPISLWRGLSDYEKNFAIFELTGNRTPKYYRERLEAIGFSNCGRVLDAACGMGQWSNALAELGNTVEGIDLMESRINVAKSLTAFRANFCNFQTGSVEKLPFNDSSFDAIFCYGAFMFTNMEKTLSEFARVLKPSGRLYLNGNTWGWYAHLIIDRGIKGKNYPLIKTSLRMFIRTFFNKSSQIVITEAWLRKKLQESKFSVLALDAEGGVSFGTVQSALPPSAYPQKFYGLRSIIEVVAEYQP